VALHPQHQQQGPMNGVVIPSGCLRTDEFGVGVEQDRDLQLPGSPRRRGDCED
jgi:hypothetical protein